MALTLNDTLLKVASRVSDTMDGDILLLVEKHIPTAIRRVAKQVARAKAPGHELLLKSQTVALTAVTNEFTTLGTTIKQADIGGLAQKFIAIDGRLHDVEIGDYKGHPVNSVSSLSLATTHDKVCYVLDYPTLYVGLGASTNTSAQVQVIHYVVPTGIENFPDDLEDYLIDDLTNLVQGESQKQQNERAVGDV